MKSRMRMLLLVSVIAALLLSACATGTAPAGDASPSEGDGEKTTIEFWFEPPSGGESAACILTAVIEPFNAQSETVFVNAVPQPQAWDSTRTAIAGGGGPDIIGTPGPSFVFELAQAGQLAALDGFVDQYAWTERFVPWALSLGSVDGVLYSIPDELETLVLYYNKTLFEQNGWTPPTTIDELIELAEIIDGAGIIPFSHANADWRPANEWFVGEFLNHVAGPDKVYAALTGEIPWTDEDFLQAITILNDMQQNGWFMGGLEFYYTTGWDDFHAALGSGEAAMNIEGTWAAADLGELYFTEENGGMEWDWVPMPSKTGEAIFDLGMGSTWSINKNSAHPEAAAEFLNYFFTPEVQAKRLRECGTAPAPVRLGADALDGVDPRIASIFAELAAASDAGNYGYTTWTFWPPKSDVYIYEEIEKVWAGDMTPEEYLMGLDALFAEELQGGEIPPLPER